VIQHFLHVYLRGAPYPVPVRVESEAFAQATVAYVAARWLRKCPQDRAEVWQVGVDSTQVSEYGVGTLSRALACFDPREIVAVRWAAQETDDVP